MSRKNSKCFVPNCKSGYGNLNKEEKRPSLFCAPKDCAKLNLWQKNIPRADRALTSRDVVCENHFTEDDIIREWKSGSVTIPFMRPKLKKDAVPTIFPNCPAYLSKKVMKRKLVERHSVLVPSKMRKVERTGINCDSSTTLFMQLYNKEVQLKLPESWSLTTFTEDGKNYLTFSEMKVKDLKPIVKRQIIFNEDLKANFFYNGKKATVSEIKNEVQEASDIEEIIEQFAALSMCPGGPDQNTCNVKSSRISMLDDETGKWRHKNCHYVMQEQNECCANCRYLFKVFKTVKNFMDKNKQGNNNQIHAPSTSHVNKALRRKNRRLLNQIKMLKENVLKTKMEFFKMQQELFDKKLSHLHSNQKNVVLECLNLSKFKSKNGRRYTPTWIMSCMLLYIKSTSTYEYLRKNNILPLCDISTIRRYLRSVNIDCGLDKKFFSAFKKKMSTKSDLQKDGVLLFDEIAVRTSVTVNPKTIKLEGFTDFTAEGVSSQKKELVDHALVFMFSSLHDSFVQPVAVYGAKGATKGDVLAQLIIKIIIEITNSNGNVQAIICDGATTNRKMWTILGVSGQKDNVVNSFINPCNDKKIYVFSDTPHLFKCVRNRLFSKPHLTTPVGKISWMYYRKLYELDTKLPGNLRVCPKISYNHIHPTNFLKMRVKLATQIFSKSVADGLKFYKKHNPQYIGSGVEPTIKFTNFMNSLFDAMNRKCYLDGIYVDSSDFNVLQEGLEFLDKWEELKNTGQIREDEFLSTSTSEGLRVSITSTIELAKQLLHNGYTFVATAKINQDSLELILP